ncbi:MAG: serine protease inhibitor [Ruminococcaceae bacterium]|nr:serine protease inhibitor [Oscillospiraceae bacterium]
MKKLIAIALVFSISIFICGCSENASAKINLMNGIKAENIVTEKPDYLFSLSQYEIAVTFAKEISSSQKGNFVISPLSLSTALGLCSNGAQGETKDELLNFLFKNGSQENFNVYLKNYTENLGSGIKSANSIWYRNDGKITVEKSFLQKNANYYSAAAYEIPFDNSGKDFINNWIKKETDNSIDAVIEKIEDINMMYLINALDFNCQWNNPYSEYSVADGIFRSNDKEYSVKYLSSNEDYYINYGSATGFMKPYKNGEFYFAAILPDSNISLEEYIASLNGEKLKNTIDSAREESVKTKLPKFSFDYSIKAEEILKKSGVKLAFDESKADFSAMGKVNGANLFVGSVLQKTFIEVNEKGTKAAAATTVEMIYKSAIIADEKEVYLDRPFLFMIIDGDTKLPVFIGAVNEF